MLDLEYELKRICQRNRDGARMTQAQRQQRLRLIARELQTLGYRNMHASSLKPKHVQALVKHWQEEELSAGTIKNRLADLRWWAEKVGKPAVLANGNAYYGIAQRVFVAEQSKASALEPQQLALVEDQHARMSLRLQEAFGLRREEAIKFQPAHADKGDHLRLKPSWCKGGRAREIPIRTVEQRELLRECHQLAGAGSLIPADRTYIEQRRIYERHTARAGLSKLHGLRHAYAQARYQELTGFSPPACGGPGSRELTAEQRAADRRARLLVSRELGHEREQITSSVSVSRSRGPVTSDSAGRSSGRRRADSITGCRPAGGVGRYGWYPLCRPSPPEDCRRDLIGAWHQPRQRSVRRRSASSAVYQMKGRCR